MRSRSLLLLLLAAGFAAAQSPPSIPRAGENIDVSIVNVDTVVTNKHGARIHGLRKEDFEIYENGVRQPIKNFAEYASDRQAASAGAALPSATSAPTQITQQPPPRQRRTIIVFVERFQLPSFRSDPLFAAMKKLLHDAVRPGDLVTVVTWNHGILGRRLDYTDNLDFIDKTIDAIAQRTTTVDHDAMDDIEKEIDSLTTWEAEVAAFGAGRGIGAAEGARESGLSFFVEENSRMSARTALLDEQRKVQTINALMRSSGSTDGKKILLLATHRLSEYAGAEALYMAGANVLPSDFRREFDGKPLIKSMIETANANGFTIYPIYAEGLASNAEVTAQYRSVQPRNTAFDYLVLNNETPMLEYVAAQTGGVAAWGSIDVTNLLPRVTDDFESYYSLAYSATPADAATRRIEVKVKDPKLTVRARKQFLPKSDTTKMEDRVIATLFGNAPPSSFDIKVRLAAPKLDEKKHFIIPVTIEVPISALTLLPRDADSSSGAFSVYTASGAVLGGVSDTHHETRQFTIRNAEIESAKQKHFTYEFKVASSTRYLRIALGVYDEVSKEYALNLVDLAPLPKK
jgi:VWFA-related protein